MNVKRSNGDGGMNGNASGPKIVENSKSNPLLGQPRIRQDLV